MTKKRSLLLQVLLMLGACFALISLLVLTGCSDESASSGDCEPTPVVREDVAFDGDDYFLTSDYGNVTNQEVFDEMVASQEGLFILLSLIDEIVLREGFCIDEGEVAEFIETFKEREEIEDWEAWIDENGFESEDEINRLVELNLLRQVAASSRVTVTDEEVEEAFEMWFAEDEEAEIEDVREDIYHNLVSQRAETEGVFFQLREEATLVIYHEALADAYQQHLMMSGAEVEVPEEVEADDSAVIARVGDEDITVGQLFAALTDEVGMQTAFGLIDPLILADRYEVDAADVEAAIDEAKESLGDEFEAALAEQGFESEEALFEQIEAGMLQDVAFNAEFAPTEERLRELYAEMGDMVSGSHILVEEAEEAAGLIEQLQESDDFSALFAELAAEHSTCPSGESGGDLGSWERGQMVPEFDDAIFELEVGEFTDEPVETQFGFHIIYKTGDAPEFEEAREELEATELAMLQQGGAMNAFLMRLRLEANMTFMNESLQTQFELMSEMAE